MSSDHRFRGLDTLVLGDKLGNGISRDVFVFKVNEEFVVKVEHEDSGLFQNVTEWALWDALQYDKELSQLFAPCHQISDCGRFLLQKRVKQPLAHEKLPKKLPCFFTDTKVENFGMLNGRVVACDYGTFSMGLVANVSKRKRIVEWWTKDGETI
jgi:hypothetical protein